MAAVRISINGTPTNVATVGDRQNGFIMAVNAAGSEVPEAGFYVKGPFGQQEPGTSIATNGHTGLGFTGAGAPNTSGGYVYLRNRWYDPQTGRFLSQDPIGLAGGVNLYAYAGNDPVTFSDPFGLCPGKAKSGTICIAFYIPSNTAALGILKGDGRGPTPLSPASMSRAYVLVNPANPGAARPVVNPTCLAIGSRSCSAPSDKNKFEVTPDGGGGFNVSVDLVNSKIGGAHINADLNFSQNSEGEWGISGTRDGYPALEAYYYNESGDIQVIANEQAGNELELFGSGDEKVR